MADRPRRKERIFAFLEKEGDSSKGQKGEPRRMLYTSGLLKPPPPSPPVVDAPLPYPREVEEKHVAGSASEKMDVSFLEKSLKTTTLELARGTVKVPPPLQLCLPSSRGLPISAVRHRDWGIVFYIRMDGGGYFHTYPHVGGPFQSLEVARDAIDRYLHDHQDRKMFMPGISNVEMGVRSSLYWPDGTRKMTSKSHPMDIFRNWTHQLAQALVDEYNEEHSEDPAYQVEEVLLFQPIYEGGNFNWYHHINFSAKAKGVDHGITKLFFAEVISNKGEHEEWVPSCLRMLEPSDNGTCHGCQNNGSGEHMKHPNDASVYTGGHVRGAVLPFGAPKLPPMAYLAGNEDELHRAEEARLRTMFRALEDARAFEKYKGPPPGRKPVTEAMRQQWLAIGGS